MKSLCPALVLAAASIASAHDIVGLSWCKKGTENSLAHCKGHAGSALVFDISIDLSDPKMHTVKWGKTGSIYVQEQHNKTVTPSRILEENDSLLWMSGDGLGHYFDIDELEEIDYWGPPFELNQNLIDYASFGNCLWALYRTNKTSTTAGVEVGKIGSASIEPLFAVDSVNAAGDAYVADSYKTILLHTKANGFTLVNKYRSCYDSKMSAAEATTQRKLQATGCEGTVVAMSWPWGWPTNDTLYVVVTQVDDNTFYANKYDTTLETCTPGYTFRFDDGWAGGGEGITFEWMDSLHSLVVKTPGQLFYALPGAGAAGKTTIVNVTGVTGASMAPEPSSVIALSSWPY